MSDGCDFVLDNSERACSYTMREYSMSEVGRKLRSKGHALCMDSREKSRSQGADDLGCSLPLWTRSGLERSEIQGRALSGSQRSERRARALKSK